MFIDIKEFMTAFGPTITAIITLTVIFRQYKVSQSQHNLELFNKRWAMLEELKILGHEAQLWEHIYTGDILKSSKDKNKNYNLMYNKLVSYSDKCAVLFGSEMEKLSLAAAENFKAYHINVDNQITCDRYCSGYSEKYTQSENTRLLLISGQLYGELVTSFDNLYKAMLNGIKDIYSW